jgi:hypothetical protein
MIRNKMGRKGKVDNNTSKITASTGVSSSPEKSNSSKIASVETKIDIVANANM